MSESVARSGNKTLYVARSVVELLSQCVVFMAFAAMIILGVVKKSDEYILYATLVTIPVVITFFARRYIKSLFLFVTIHIVLIAAAIMLGRTDAESTAYFISVFVVCVRSVSVRIANVRKTEYMKESRFSTKTEDVNDDEKKAVMQTTERMSVVYCIVMIVGSTLGGQNGSTKLVSFESLMFALFIILCLIGNQLKGVNDLFISNTGKSEFPARRITGINMVTAAVVAVLMIMGMLLFYRGDGGNIFALMGSILGVVFRPLLKLLLMLMKENDEALPQQPTQPINKDDSLYDETEIKDYADNPVMQAVFVAFTVVIITGLLIAVIYVVVRYARKFKESRDDNGDEVEFIGTGRHERKIRRSKHAVEKNNLAVNMQYRKAFKKAAMPDKRKRKEKMAANSLVYMQPEDITRNNITSNAVTAERITRSYEKARYSDKNISKEELEFMLDFVKNDKYNKHT